MLENIVETTPAIGSIGQAALDILQGGLIVQSRFVDATQCITIARYRSSGDLIGGGGRHAIGADGHRACTGLIPKVTCADTLVSAHAIAAGSTQRAVRQLAIHQAVKAQRVGVFQCVRQQAVGVVLETHRAQEAVDRQTTH